MSRARPLSPTHKKTRALDVRGFVSGNDANRLPVLGAALQARGHVVFIDFVAALAIHAFMLRMNQAHQAHGQNAGIHLPVSQHLIRFNDEDAQLAAADKLQSQLDKGYLVALNLAHELLTEKTEQNSAANSASKRLRALRERIEIALNDSTQLEL